MSWWRRNRIKEKPKGKMYGSRHNVANYSMWDNMSLIERLITLMAPMMITYIDYQIIDGLFGMLWWVSVITSIVVTLVFYTMMFTLINWLSDYR